MSATVMMTRNVFASGRHRGPAVVGMVHALALPGTPRSSCTIDRIVEQACAEARTYMAHGVDAVLVENMHDTPYVQPGSRMMGPDTVACMTRICAEVRREIGDRVPAGVQVLASANREALAVALATGFDFVRVENFVFAHVADEGWIDACAGPLLRANREALAVALATGFDFVRVENFVFAHVADEGWIDACAGPLLRYRKSIGAESIRIFADIKKKHASHAVTGDTSLEDTARAAEFFGTDGLVLTGRATGDPADVDQLRRLKAVSRVPVLIGSGIAATNLHQYALADAFIVGSAFKAEGQWQNPICEKNLGDFMRKHRDTFKSCQ
ncbi:unnamed protein product [Notodromas monacha]|uniref:BtpA family membrane complex biogenesis protein n=1 Tax=Notodromas monacha TaxID=399045 RepID=A0A7R9BYD2_9CRUS|nr:unnamed protein product [Notodromas monacha]CAG0922404.1 unnamed protein product [Notodromas monacha]